MPHYRNIVQVLRNRSFAFRRKNKVIESHDSDLLRISKRIVAVAAPDHEIGQYIQKSALFPGRADGGTEGPELFAGNAKRSRWWGVSIRGSVAYAPENFFKNQLSNRVFSAFLQTEMVS